MNIDTCKLPLNPQGKLFNFPEGPINKLTLINPSEGKKYFDDLNPYSEASELFKRIVLQQREGKINENRLKNIYKNSFQDWSYYGNTFKAATEELNTRLRKLKVDLEGEMAHLRLFLTTGDQKGHIGHYTQDNSIFIISDAGGPYKLWLFDFVQRFSTKFKLEFYKHLSHEFYHLLSRFSPEKQNDLYEKLGFFRCDAELPEAIKSCLYWNTDIPFNVRRKVGDQWAMPISIIERNNCHFDGSLNRGKDSVHLPNFLKVKWVIVKEDEQNNWYVCRQNNEVMFLDQEPDLADEFGIDYIVHPEEMLAEIFVRWVFPEIITNEKVKDYFEILKEAFSKD